MFPPDKDERVERTLQWVQRVSYDLGGWGVSACVALVELLLMRSVYRSCISFCNQENEEHFLLTQTTDHPNLQTSRHSTG